MVFYLDLKLKIFICINVYKKCIKNDDIIRTGKKSFGGGLWLSKVF